MTARGKSTRNTSTRDLAERTETVAAPLPAQVGGGVLTLTLHWRGERITHMSLGKRAEAGQGGAAKLPETRPSDARLSEAGLAVQAALARLAQGEPADFPELPLAWDQVPPFSRAVLETLFSRVGHGQTVTYGELAALCGKPGAARAVGGAMARNPWPLVVPCHRVLGSGGALTGYTNPHGLDLKALLLSLEGADPSCKG